MLERFIPYVLNRDTNIGVILIEISSVATPQQSHVENNEVAHGGINEVLISKALETEL